MAPTVEPAPMFGARNVAKIEAGAERATADEEVARAPDAAANPHADDDQPERVREEEDEQRRHEAQGRHLHVGDRRG